MRVMAVRRADHRDVLELERICAQTYIVFWTVPGRFLGERELLHIGVALGLFRRETAHPQWR